MRSALLRFGTLAFSAALLAGPGGPVACHSEEGEGALVGVSAELLLPRTILSKATRLELRVLDGTVACDAATGVVSYAEGPGASREVAKGQLGTAGCPGGTRFCGDISVPKSAAPRVFEAKAFSDAAQTAFGCTTAIIDRDSLPLSIRMLRFLAPSVCGDRVLQPTEQCEPGGSAICDAQCQSNEVTLSVGSDESQTSTGKANDKSDASFVWPAASGAEGLFAAFFTDRAVPTSGGASDVGLRVLSADLTPLTTPVALARGSIFLPSSTELPPPPAAGKQALPRAAMLGGKYYVVFEDDSGSTSDIRLRVLTSAFAAEGTTPTGINGGSTGEDAVQTAPAIAAGRERLFVTWQDDADGSIVGRTVTPGSLELGNQNQISSGSGNARPEVAATSKGYVVVWTNNTGVKLRTFDENGTPSGGEQAVSDGGATGARITSLPDGRFAIAWSSGGDIFVQRFDERGVPFPGDKTTRINDLVTDGAQTEPTIAATPAVNGSYVVAWHDTNSGHIRARFLGGASGFLFNNVDGQSSEFQASRIGGRTRKAPVAIVGGSAPFVVIGWEDQSASGAGIIARRFPLPSD